MCDLAISSLLLWYAKLLCVMYIPQPIATHNENFKAYEIYKINK